MNFLVLLFSELISSNRPEYFAGDGTSRRLNTDVKEAQEKAGADGN